MDLPRLHFAPEPTHCPHCAARLRSYKNLSRTVQMAGGVSFVAVEHVKYCARGHPRMLFRSDRLRSLVNPGCTYTNDVLVEAAQRRFLEGRSSREIAIEMNNGISERHVRRLSNTALDVLVTLHERQSPALRQAMGRWVLQIDGTVDGEFEMIIAARDATSSFLLTGKRCSSESEDAVREILTGLKDRFGTPCGTMSDLRSGILAAVRSVFPGVPTGICKYHFLRDEGKDLMESRHTALGKLLRTHGVKSALKRVLEKLPAYAPSILAEVGHGYCSDLKVLAEMEARRAMEQLLQQGERTGLGFPFSLRHLEFTERCGTTLDLLRKFQETAHSEAIASAVKLLEEVVADQQVIRVRDELQDITRVFQGLREAMYPKHQGTPLSGEPQVPSEEMEPACDRVISELEAYQEVSIPPHVFVAAKHLIAEYRKWKGHLFVRGLEGVIIPHTNNGLEQVFRRLRRSIRKRCGDKATGRQLTRNGERLLLYQNMANRAYVEAVFGKQDLPEVFGKERSRLPKSLGMGRKERDRLLYMGMGMLARGRVPASPYAESLWTEREESRATLPQSPTPRPDGLCPP